LEWLLSFGIHPIHHWCLVRPVLAGVHKKFPSIEVDIVLGNVGTPVWPPPVDYLVAVEAKCWARKWEDLEPWKRVQSPRTNLWDQVKRNRESGFSRVAGVDIVCTEPGNDYFSALAAASTLAGAEQHWLRREADKNDEAGYAVFAFGAVSWKDESKSGAIGLIECRTAPVLDSPNQVLAEAVRGILTSCPQPQVAPYHFVCRDSIWQVLTI